MPVPILFVCAQGRLRSRTAYTVARERGFPCSYGGVDTDAEMPLTEEVIQEAQVIVCMENRHANRLFKEYRALMEDKTVLVLGIPDDFDYMDPYLVRWFTNFLDQLPS